MEKINKIDDAIDDDQRTEMYKNNNENHNEK